jgi:integrase
MLERTENTEIELLTYKRAFAEFQEFKAGTVSAGQQSVLSAHIGFFMRCVGDHQPLKSLCIAHWESFWNQLQHNLKSDKWVQKYGNSVLASVRGFLTWCYDTERLESLPRFVTSKLYRIEVPTTKPIPFTKKEVLSILSVATEEQRLLYLLMLNCAMTQKDVSDLRPDEVDLGKGTITRRRSKHRHRSTKRVPTVTYHLWKPAWELLRRFGDFSGERVFANQRGNPLVQASRNDSPAAAFRVIREKLAIRKKSLKTFRKTGTTTIGQKGSPFRGWRSVYLGNAPAEITDKHYDGTDELPEEVTEYIRTQLEIPNSAAKLRALAAKTAQDRSSAPSDLK